MTGKVTVLSPKQADPPVKAHPGWKRPRKPLRTAGDCKSLIGWVIRQTVDGYMLPEDGRSLTWMILQQAGVIEKAELESRIADLERKLAEALAHGR